MAASPGRPSRSTPAARKLFELVRRSGADLGQEIGWRDTGGVCDGNNIAACGVPVVDTMGARGGAIHSRTEYLIVESLVERAQLSALTILRLAQRGGFVSFRVRPARAGDFDAIYEMAKLTGGGFTNLPADKGTLVAKLSRSRGRLRAATTGAPEGDLFVFVLENAETGEIRGTCQVFSRIGVEQPFYSYRISKLTQTSPELGRTFRTEMLTLCTDFNGCSRGRRAVPPSRRARRRARARRAARAQPLSVHPAQPRALRRHGASPSCAA